MRKVTRRVEAIVVMAAMFTALIPFSAVAAWQSINPHPQETMESVNAYWIDKNKNGGGLGPSRATYQIGNLAMYRAFCLPESEPALNQAICESYLGHTLDWANRHGWKLNPKKKEADNQAAGQVFIELYTLCMDRSLSDKLRKKCNQTQPAQKLAAISRSIDDTIQRCYPDPNASQCHRDGGRQYSWTWIDAVFMAAPVFSKFGDDQGLPHDLPYNLHDYFDTLYQSYMNLKDQFYDEGEGLWFRDKNAVYQPAPEPCPKAQPRCRTQNDKKSFWSRGNGWIMAALPRILDGNPPRDHRDEYKKMLRDMAKSLKNRQRSDGFWNVSLDDPNDFPGPETSGTSMFTYAIAWGINNGVLNANTYKPVILKAWDALAHTAVENNGKLGYVQRAADEPCDWMHPDQEGRNSFGQPCTWNQRDDD